MKGRRHSSGGPKPHYVDTAGLGVQGMLTAQAGARECTRFRGDMSRRNLGSPDGIASPHRASWVFTQYRTQIVLHRGSNTMGGRFSGRARSGVQWGKPMCRSVDFCWVGA